MMIITMMMIIIMMMADPNLLATNAPLDVSVKGNVKMRIYVARYDL